MEVVKDIAIALTFVQRSIRDDTEVGIQNGSLKTLQMMYSRNTKKKYRNNWTV